MIGILRNILAMRCPKCRVGNLFTHGAYNLKKFNKMPKFCEHCHQAFQPEPSFYTGAMYVSYALQVAFVVSLLLILNIFYPEATITVYLCLVSIPIIALMPLLFRISRSIYIHIFIKYNPDL